MKREIVDDFISGLINSAAAKNPQEFGSTLQLIRNLLGQFSRTQEDLTEIARAIREEVAAFPSTVEIKVKEFNFDELAPEKQVTQEITTTVRAYAKQVATWVEGLSPLETTLPPPPQPTAESKSTASPDSPPS